MNDPGQRTAGRLGWHLLARADVLAGLLFVGVAVLGLWLSRDYPIGTALRMGTGYVPRLLCWMLLVLGIVVLAIGLRAPQPPSAPFAGQSLRPVVLAPLSLLAFALAISRVGIVVATVALVVVAAFASRESRPHEAVIAAVSLVIATLAIFVWGLGLPLQVWPEW
jgi:hypothetical protein